MSLGLTACAISPVLSCRVRRPDPCPNLPLLPTVNQRLTGVAPSPGCRSLLRSLSGTWVVGICLHNEARFPGTARVQAADVLSDDPK